MIYICVPSRNHARTVGLLLWKVRQVFADHPREYHLLVANDGSSDATADVLESYASVLPMTVVSHDRRLGYARSVDDLLRRALTLTDRPKRDAAIVINADFSVSPGVVPDIVRRLESGADVVVAEADGGYRSWLAGVVQRAAPRLLRPGVAVPGLADLLSGVIGVRLVTLKRCMREDGQPLLECDGLCARAELVARFAAEARQIAAIPIESAWLRRGAVRFPVRTAWRLYRAGRRVRVPAPEVEVQGTA